VVELYRFKKLILSELRRFADWYPNCGLNCAKD